MNRRAASKGHNIWAALGHEQEPATSKGQDVQAVLGHEREPGSQGVEPVDF